jgi:hypothetical protein
MNKGMIPIFFATALSVSNSPLADEEQEAIAADCRVEGEAAGMSGKALEAFVTECVEELSGVTYDNQVGPESEPGNR